MEWSASFNPLAPISSIANLISGKLSNDANERMNEANIAAAKEINAQQMQLQRETNAQNAAMPMRQYSQLRALGASGAAALGALGAPGEAGTATLNVPQATIPHQPVNIDMANAMSMSRLSDAQIENIKADTAAKNENTSGKKLENYRNQLGKDAFDTVNRVVNDYIAELTEDEIPDYNDFLHSLTDEERAIIDKSAVHTQLAQELLTTSQQHRGNRSNITNADIDAMIGQIDSSYYGQERAAEFVQNLLAAEESEWDHFAAGIQHAITVANEHNIKLIADNLYELQKNVAETKNSEWNAVLSAIFGDEWAKQFVNVASRIGARRVVARSRISRTTTNYNFNQAVGN